MMDKFLNHKVVLQIKAWIIDHKAIAALAAVLLVLSGYWAFGVSAAFLIQEWHKGGQAYVVYPLIEESEALDLKNATDEFERLKNKYSDILSKD